MNEIINYLESNGLKNIEVVEDLGNLFLIEVELNNEKELLKVELESNKIIIRHYVPELDKFITVLTDFIDNEE